jgi:Chlorophyll A-B binding protein
MKLFIPALFAATAAAFAPSNVATSKSALKMSYETMPGATAPIGYWDPLQLTSEKDATSFAFARAGEVKNGRIAMLAVIGYIVPEVFRFPGEIVPGLKFADIPNGIDAINVIPGQVSHAHCLRNSILTLNRINLTYIVI